MNLLQNFVVFRHHVYAQHRNQIGRKLSTHIALKLQQV